MPELPEVEALRRGLEKYLLGKKISSVEVKYPKLISSKGNVRSVNPAKTKLFIKGLAGEVIENIDRRAKNLIFRLKSGGVLLVHLKMTGQLVYKDAKHTLDGGHPIEISEEKLPHKHTHVIFHLSQGILYYNDTRKFGYLLFYPTTAAFLKENHFKNLGPEPFSKEFTPTHFLNNLRKRNTKLKIALMDQRIVVGLGNIYCDEVCFKAGIRPDRNTQKITASEANKLFRTIQMILQKATALGGSSVASYRLADGSRGNYAREHKVYGRTGKPCAKC